MIVGGHETDKNQACNLDNGTFNCFEFASNLTLYAYTPILFLVDDNYKNC